MITPLSLLKLNLTIAILMGLYHFFMRRSMNFRGNRVLLNLIPLIGIATLFIPTWTASSTFTMYLPEYVVGTATSIDGGLERFFFNPILSIWLLGSIVTLLLTLRRLRQIERLLKQDETGHAAFTFLGRIHIDSSVVSPYRDLIHRHEQAHVDQKHSLDLLWYECWKLVFWFNPALYIGQRFLKEQHEYLADEKVMNESDKYPEVLIAQVFGIESLPLANEFNGINIKNRINMMTKEKTRSQSIKWYSGITLAAIAMICVSWTSFDAIPSLNLPFDNAKEHVYEKVDKMPMFPGCEDQRLNKDEMKRCSFGKMIEYMSKEVKYPETSEKDGTEGTVMVKFIVSGDGTVKDAQVSQSVEKHLDKEALRVVMGMPNWIPGVHEGKKVSVSMVLPIKFALAESK